MLLDNILSYTVIFIRKKLKNSQGPFGTIVNNSNIYTKIKKALKIITIYSQCFFVLNPEIN